MFTFDYSIFDIAKWQIATVGCYRRLESAKAQIQRWKEREAKGKRPDVTAAFLVPIIWRECKFKCHLHFPEDFLKLVASLSQKTGPFTPEGLAQFFHYKSEGTIPYGPTKYFTELKEQYENQSNR